MNFGRLMPIFLLVLAVVVPPAQAKSPSKPNAKACSRHDTIAATAVVDYLDSWQNVHLAYNKFAPQCFLNAPGKGISASIVKLMETDWALFDQYMGFAADKGFESFVLDHLDQAVSPADLDKVGDHARHDCPKDGDKFCADIAAKIDTLQKAPNKMPGPAPAQNPKK